MSLVSGICFTIIAVLMIANVGAAPSKYKNVARNRNCSDDDNENDSEEFHDLIDQRQNGTENYRISLKDFVFVWAPSDVLLTAAALLESQLLSDQLLAELPNFEKPNEGSEEASENKPLPNGSTTETVTTEDDKITINSARRPTNKRSKLRFPSLVTPIFKKP